jgi:hypothetical protein
MLLWRSSSFARFLLHGFRVVEGEGLGMSVTTPLTIDGAPGVRWRADAALSAQQIRLVAERLVYSCESICGLEVVDERELHVQLVDTSAGPAVDAVLTELADAVAAEPVTPPEVLRRTADRRHPVAHDRSPLAPPVADEAEEAVDRILAGLADDLGAVRRTFPSSISREVMDTCDYVALFPQNAYLVCEVPHDRAMAERARRGDAADATRLTDLMLSPAVCFHAYPELAGQQLDRPVVLSARGRCFRHEATWRLAPHRLREFSMRELVFVGEPDMVEATRTTLLDRTWDLFVGWGLPGRIESANDPFYFSDDADKAQYQLAAHSKYELVVELPTGESFAVASFNNVRSSLCARFGVQAGAAPAWSGCAAFGLARWVHALAVVHGGRLDRWPIPPTPQQGPLGVPTQELVDIDG